MTYRTTTKGDGCDIVTDAAHNQPASPLLKSQSSTIWIIKSFGPYQGIGWLYISVKHQHNPLRNSGTTIKGDGCDIVTYAALKQKVNWQKNQSLAILKYQRTSGDVSSLRNSRTTSKGDGCDSVTDGSLNQSHKCNRSTHTEGESPLFKGAIMQRVTKLWTTWVGRCPTKLWFNVQRTETCSTAMCHHLSAVQSGCKCESFLILTKYFRFGQNPR